MVLYPQTLKSPVLIISNVPADSLPVVIRNVRREGHCKERAIIEGIGMLRYRHEKMRGEYKCMQNSELEL